LIKFRFIIQGSGVYLTSLFFITAIMGLLILILFIVIITIAAMIGFLNPKFDKIVIKNTKKTILWYNGYTDGIAQRKYIILW